VQLSDINKIMYATKTFYTPNVRPSKPLHVFLITSSNADWQTQWQVCNQRFKTSHTSNASTNYCAKYHCQTST